MALTAPEDAIRRSGRPAHRGNCPASSRRTRASSMSSSSACIFFMGKASPVTATRWDMPAGSGDRWPEDYEHGRPGWLAAAFSFQRRPDDRHPVRPSAG
jgi:hypothetical protein